MKYIFTSVCLGLALIFAASAQDRHSGGNATATGHRGSVRASSVTAPAATTTGRVVQPTMTTQRNISTAPFRQRTYSVTPSTNANATVRYNNTAANARVRANVATNRQRNVGVSRTRN